MIKVLFTFCFMFFSVFSYSQEGLFGLSMGNMDSLRNLKNQNKPTEMSEAEKDSLRSLHSSGVQFNEHKEKTPNKVIVEGTNIKEEEFESTTTVKHYNGVKDTLYNEFKYTKPKKQD